MDRVAVILSTYNGERYIREQIDSVLSSAYSNYKIYISDDCSSDATYEIIKSYEAKYPDKIHAAKNVSNLGCTLNFLNAAVNADAEYFMFCDQDDVWNSDKMETTLRRMKKMENKYGKDTPLAVFTDALVVDEQLRPIYQSFFQSSKLNPLNTDLPHLLMENKLIGCTVMFNRPLQQIVAERQLPMKARFHDWWIALIAASMGKISYLKEATMSYRQHGSNVVGNQSFLAYAGKRFRALKDQRRSIEANYRQAREFFGLYSDLLSEENREVFRSFINLPEMNPIARRAAVLRSGYLKTGILRNIGLIFIL